MAILSSRDSPRSRATPERSRETHVIMHLLDNTKGTYIFDGRNLIPISVSTRWPFGRWDDESCAAITIGSNSDSVYISFPATSASAPSQPIRVTPPTARGKLLNAFILNNCSALLSFIDDPDDSSSYYVNLCKLTNAQDPLNYSVHGLITPHMKNSEYELASYTLRNDGKYLIIGYQIGVRIFDVNDSSAEGRFVKIEQGCKDVFVCNANVGMCELIVYVLSQQYCLSGQYMMGVTRLCYKLHQGVLRSQPTAKNSAVFNIRNPYCGTVEVRLSPSTAYVSYITSSGEPGDLFEVRIDCVSCGAKLSEFKTSVFDWLAENDEWICSTPPDESKPGLDLCGLTEDDSDDTSVETAEFSLCGGSKRNVKSKQSSLCHPNTTSLLWRVEGSFNQFYASPNATHLVLTTKDDDGLFSDLHFFTRQPLCYYSAVSRFITSPATKGGWSPCARYFATFNKDSRTCIWSSIGERLWSGVLNGIVKFTWLQC